MATKWITAKDFVTSPLSVATRQVIEDIQLMVSKGITIDMGIWVNKESGKVCSVCAGGAACVTFNTNHHITSVKYPGRTVVNCSKEEWDKIPTTFNDVRRAEYRDAYESWYGESGERILLNELYHLELGHVYMSGILKEGQLKRLYKQMNEFADVLEKHGR